MVSSFVVFWPNDLMLKYSGFCAVFFLCLLLASLLVPQLLGVFLRDYFILEKENSGH